MKDIQKSSQNLWILSFDRKHYVYFSLMLRFPGDLTAAASTASHKWSSTFTQQRGMEWFVFRCDVVPCWVSHMSWRLSSHTALITKSQRGQSPASLSYSGKRIYFPWWKSVRGEAFHTPQGSSHAYPKPC